MSLVNIPSAQFFAFATLITIKDRKSQITIPAVRGLFAVAPSSMSEGSVEIAGLTNNVFFPQPFSHIVNSVPSKQLFV